MVCRRTSHVTDQLQKLLRQIVIVSDGFDNTFAGMYYDKITWTTGDDEGGKNGLLRGYRSAFMPRLFLCVFVCACSSFLLPATICIYLYVYTYV